MAESGFGEFHRCVMCYWCTARRKGLKSAFATLSWHLIVWECVLRSAIAAPDVILNGTHVYVLGRDG